MNYLSKNVAGFVLSLALTTCFGVQIEASSRSSHSSSGHSSKHHCSIGCSDSSSKSCKDVCGSGARVHEGCVFVPERQEIVLDSETCEPMQVTVPGANLYYRDMGKSKHGRPTIVFVHSLGATSDSWRCQQEQLSKCFRTIAVDLRGNGRSDVTDPESIQYTHELFANDIFMMLQDPALNVSEKVIFVGNGIGGSIGIVFATAYSDMLCKLVIVNSGPGLYLVNDCAVSPYCDPQYACGESEGSCCDFTGCTSLCWPYPSFTEQSLQQQAYALECGFYNCYNAGEEGFDDCLTQSFSNYFAWEFPVTILNEPCQPQLASLQAQSVMAITQTVFNEVLSNIIYNAWTQDLRPLLELIEVPTLICIGTLDLEVPNGAGIYLNNHIAHSKLVKFENKGHMPQATSYKKFNKVLKSFIEHKHFPEFLDVPDTGCCVCPLIKPLPFIPCSLTPTT